MRPRSLERPAKGEAQKRLGRGPKAQPREGFGSSERSWREVFKGLGKVLESFGEVFSRWEKSQKTFLKGKKILRVKKQPPRVSREQTLRWRTLRAGS